MSGSAITVVSGLPRSGTSMMMRVLEAGGLEVRTDAIRAADHDNPKGYYEFERVKDLPGDQAWLEETRGRVVKVISYLLKRLPATYRYRVIFMRRDMAEILASQRQMLLRRASPTDRVTDEEMAGLFRKHLSEIDVWLISQAHVEVLYVDYGDVLRHPAEQVRRVNQFLGDVLEEARMIEAVDQTLYRQRR